MRAEAHFSEVEAGRGAQRDTPLMLLDLARTMRAAFPGPLWRDGRVDPTLFPAGRGPQPAVPASASRSVRSSWRVVAGLSSTCRRGKGGSPAGCGGASGRASITTAPA